MLLRGWGRNYKTVRANRHEDVAQLYGFSSAKKMASVMLKTDSGLRLYNKVCSLCSKYLSCGSSRATDCLVVCRYMRPIFDQTVKNRSQIFAYWMCVHAMMLLWSVSHCVHDVQYASSTLKSWTLHRDCGCCVQVICRHTKR